MEGPEPSPAGHREQRRAARFTAISRVVITVPREELIRRVRSYEALEAKRRKTRAGRARARGDAAPTLPPPKSTQGVRDVTGQM